MLGGKREIATAASGESSVDITSNDKKDSIPNGKKDVGCPFLEIPDAVFPTETSVLIRRHSYVRTGLPQSPTRVLHRRPSVLLLYVHPTLSIGTAKAHRKSTFS